MRLCTTLVHASLDEKLVEDELLPPPLPPPAGDCMPGVEGVCGCDGCRPLESMPKADDPFVLMVRPLLNMPPPLTDTPPLLSPPFDLLILLRRLFMV